MAKKRARNLGFEPSPFEIVTLRRSRVAAPGSQRIQSPFNSFGIGQQFLNFMLAAKMANAKPVL